ncbi:carbamoyltransferase [Lachnospiraceae bacterium C1.1]|nr:carbamoyltransferase [Lachnospiraceae bacterium C1.1]
MIILGISCLYHDSAACLIKDGNIIAAAQEERFTRIKHDSRIPENAMKYCLKEAGIKAEELDAVVYYDNPLIMTDRFMDNLAFLGEECDSLLNNSFDMIFSWKLWIHEKLKDVLGSLGKHGKLLVTKHHISHAASAFYPSPFEDAVILTIDGVGEWTTTAIGIGHGNEVKLLEEIKYPHSIGMFYSAFTYFCGFKVNSGEYKFMGLAPYGKPIYYDKIKENVISIMPDGSFCLNLDYFDFYRGTTMINESKFEELFGGTRRKSESRITKREMDIAASVQKITEEMIIGIAKHAKEKYGQNINNLVLAGGVALNCVANGKLTKEKIFYNVWIQPASDDAGGALGCALYAYYDFFKNDREVVLPDGMNGSLLGPKYDNIEIENTLKRYGAKYKKIEDKEVWAEKIAEFLTQGKICGLMMGRLEFGPRALGDRSIIADSRSEEMQSKLNLKIKYRESFRPFAPIVLDERRDDYFDLPCDSPYMLKVGNVSEKRRLPFDIDEELERFDNDMLKSVSVPRSDVPAITHVDYSARVQTVDNKRNPDLHLIMEKFNEMTGCGVLVNTSFNVRGEPIVCTPEDAYKCFMRTDMDVLVIEDYILHKEEQPEFCEDKDWRAEYELD